MKQIVQGTLTTDAVKVDKEITWSSLRWLLLLYLADKITLQRILYLLALATFGIGDGVTAAYMIERSGPVREINPMVKLAYFYSGGQGIVFVKTWLTILILSFVWSISRRKNTYWMVNGFLFALFIGGIMAMRANMMAGMGMVPPSPISIVLTYLLLAVLFVTIGDEIDQLLEAKRVKGGYERRVPRSE